MSEKRRIMTPGRFLNGERWYVVQFTMDNKFCGPLQPWQLEDENGANGNDRTFKLQDSGCCHAPWSDGHIYEATIAHESDREDCLKFLEEKRKDEKKKKGYATHHLKLTIPDFKDAWNQKMCSSRQTLKRLSKRKL